MTRRLTRALALGAVIALATLSLQSKSSEAHAALTRSSPESQSRLSTPPSTVVLSACDSGYSEARPGEELAGLTSALLGMGARAVVASIGLVPDTPATSSLMVDFHRRLIAGIEPAGALAAAQDDIGADPVGFCAAASFVYVGG